MIFKKHLARAFFLQLLLVTHVMGSDNLKLKDLVKIRTAPSEEQPGNEFTYIEFSPGTAPPADLIDLEYISHTDLCECLDLNHVRPLDHIQFKGSIPSWFGNLTKLVMLDLDNNQFTGVIPKELGQLTKLGILNLNNSQLTGTIPKELGILTNLMELYLKNNQLTGDIPKELGQLTKLKWLGLNKNQLTGGIPKELGQLKELIGLYLYDNQLTGGIPKELGQFEKLRGLYLHKNYLTGSIPGDVLTIMTSCMIVNLVGNCFSPKDLGCFDETEIPEENLYPQRSALKSSRK